MKITYKIYFTRLENGQRVTIGYRLLKEPSKLVKYKKKAFPIDLASPIRIFKLQRIYVMDYATGAQLAVEGSENALMSPDELDMIVSTKIIRELTSGLKESLSEKIIYIIVGCVIGFLVGFIVGYLIMQGKLDALYNELMQDVIVLGDDISNSIASMMRGGN